MIIILLLGVLLTASGVWLIKTVIDAKKKKSNENNKVEFTEETGYTLASMGVVMMISSIVKMSGGIGTVGFVFVFLLNIIGLAGLLYLIYQKHYSHN